MKLTNAQIRERVTAAVLAALDKGVSPWRKPWVSNGIVGAAHNAASGHVYRGVNVFTLWAVGSANGYPTSQWLTFNQARALGGSVRKGERSTPVVFSKPLRVRAAPGEKGADSEGFKKIFVLRMTPVFNVAQCDGLTLPAREIPKPVAVVEGADAALVDAALALARERDVTVKLGGDRAAFNIFGNFVTMPEPGQFTSGAAFAATLYHELTHATGHESRLGRTFGASFGDEAYAFEELVAELGAAMVCSAREIGSELVESHAAYIDHWRNLLKTDPKALFEAAKLAEAAADWLLPELAAKRSDASDDGDEPEALPKAA